MQTITIKQIEELRKAGHTASISERKPWEVFVAPGPRVVKVDGWKNYKLN